MKTEKQLNNSIYLMYVIAELYMKRHELGVEDFLKLDGQVKLLKFIADAPWVFDGLPDEEMLAEAERYVNARLSD